MAKLDFALWDGVGGYSEKYEHMADVYEEHIKLAQRIEELGWHSYFVIEHQNSPVGRITAPSVFLTAIARATSTLRIGVSVLIGSWLLGPMALSCFRERAWWQGGILSVLWAIALTMVLVASSGFAASQRAATVGTKVAARSTPNARSGKPRSSKTYESRIQT